MRVHTFLPTCPANTQSTSPVEVSTSFPDGLALNVEIVIPLGHRGITGLQLALAHQSIIPYGKGQWLIDENARLTYDLSEHPESGAYSVWLFNTDFVAHQWVVRFRVEDRVRTRRPQQLTEVPIEDIYKAYANRHR